ncbi:colanic acid biosynthesis glycosyl transferase WcaI [Hymenobacter gelipurpurascens]|uniref:Colanic acid biosynthesis glycosyl transferase WcaI n=1 Tax=Hymenobacter gelipurpurascens TaxID=89968 RepID=A0A212UH65_9BACT|nr:WcaI family glycosyltransferase [Hymenobacter gelipurpurascens]SNC77536.1 colanic acid biosynthesis glycosyl transferase WcaI [Hymenobacter gelipurpurascens]
MKKRILLIGYNFYPELTGIGKYSGEMLLWLSRQGFNCTALTAYPYYPSWKVQDPYVSRQFSYTTEHKEFPSGGTLCIHRCPMYVPSVPSGLKRVLLDASFLFSACLKLLWLIPRNRFDLIISVAPSFHFGLLALLARSIRKCLFMYHIQDLQIEAARDLGIIKSAKAVKAMFGLERFILNRADYISSISAPMVARIQSKVGRKVMLLPNWADTCRFYPLPDRGQLKRKFGFQEGDKIVLYSGAIGEKQGLEAILYAAQVFRHQARFKFLICGSGPYKQRLEALCEKLQLTNVQFIPLQADIQFNAFLNMADVHLVIQKSSAGDLVMPSKLTTILAVGGLAIITANEGSGLYAMVSHYNIGLLVPAEDQMALNACLEKALANDHDQLRGNARRYAESYLSIDSIMNEFVSSVLK